MFFSIYIKIYHKLINNGLLKKMCPLTIERAQKKGFTLTRYFYWDIVNLQSPLFNCTMGYYFQTFFLTLK